MRSCTVDVGAVSVVHFGLHSSTSNCQPGNPLHDCGSAQSSTSKRKPTVSMHEESMKIWNRRRRKCRYPARFHSKLFSSGSQKKGYKMRSTTALDRERSPFSAVAAASWPCPRPSLLRGRRRRSGHRLPRPPHLRPPRSPHHGPHQRTPYEHTERQGGGRTRRRQ